MPEMQGYDVVPLPLLESTIGNTDILARITLTFPRSLSLSQLEEAWYGLVRVWPILAARIRPTPSTPSGLSYCIPHPSTLEAFEARSRTTSKPLERHISLVDASSRSIGTYQPIVGRAVHGTLSRTQISIGTAPDRAEQDRMTCENACTSWKQLLQADQAFVTAQATKWADATTVTIAFSHTVGDAFAIKTIFRAWQDSLQNQLPEPVQDLGKDPFIEYLPPDGRNAVDKDGKPLGLPLGWRKYGFVKKVRLISSLLWEIKVRKPEKKLKQFYIYMPEETVQQLVAQAKSDIELIRASATTATNNDDDDDDDDDNGRSGGRAEKQTANRDLNVSTFNVLFAWLLQHIHAINPKPNKLSSVITIINAKHRPPAGHRLSDYPQHPFWNGAFGAPLLPLSSADYASLPLGQVALHIRESLQSQIEPGNIQANIVTLLQHSRWKKPSGKLIFFAEPNHYWYGCTEWRSTKFNQVDFGAALAHTEKEKGRETEEAVRPVAIGTHMEIPMTQRNRWVIFGDAGKGVWFSGGLTRKEALNKKGFGKYEFVQ